MEASTAGKGDAAHNDAKKRKRKRKKPYVPIAERVALKREKLAAAALVQSQKQSQKQRQKQSQKQSQTQTQSQTQSQTQAKHGRQGEATESLQSHGPYVGQAAGRDTAQPSQQTTVGLGSDTSRIAAKGQKKKRRRSSVKPETISLKSVDKGKDREGGRHSEGQKPNTAVRVKLHVQPDPKDYGGMGFARASCWLDMGDVAFNERYEELFQEHIEGFSGRSFRKARKRESGDMLWRIRLNEKTGQAAAAEADTSKQRRRKKPHKQSLGAGAGKGGSFPGARQNQANHRQAKIEVDSEARNAMIQRYRNNQRMRRQKFGNTNMEIKDTLQ